MKRLNWFWKWWPETLAAVLALVFTISIPMQALFLPPSRAYLGFVQVDQPVYYACARELFERGNGVFYANPYSNVPDSPRIYTHFCFLVIGWLWRLTGISFTVIDGAIRILLGPLMLLLASAIYRRVQPRNTLGDWGAAMMLCGSGLAWFGGAMNTLVDFLLLGKDHRVHHGFFDWFRSMYLTEFFWAESGYGDWHVNLFRNLFYSPEVMYHVLFFCAVLAFLARRWGIANVAVFLTWWSHPFTGLQLNLITGVWLIYEWWKYRGVALKVVAVNAAIGVLFLGYYGIFLAQFPEHVSTLEQMRGFGAIMLPERMLWAYGLFLLLPFKYFRSTTFQREWAERPEMRFVVVWLGVSLFLNLHDKIPFMPSMQPMHFSHGYLAMPLVMLSVSALRVWEKEWLAQGRRAKVVALAAVLFFLHVPDNVIWSLRVISRLPESSLLFAPLKQEVELLRALDAVPSTETILLASAPGYVGAATNPLLPVLTHHNGLTSHVFNTPEFDTKQKLEQEFITEPRPELLRAGLITAILAHRERWEELAMTLGSIVGPVLAEYDEAVLRKVNP